MLFKSDKVRVRFLQSVSDTGGWYFDSGDVHEVEAVAAKNFIAGGVAEQVDDSVPIGRAPMTCPGCGGQQPSSALVCAFCARRLQ